MHIRVDAASMKYGFVTAQAEYALVIGGCIMLVGWAIAYRMLAAVGYRKAVAAIMAIGVYIPWIQFAVLWAVGSRAKAERARTVEFGSQAESIGLDAAGPSCASELK